MIETANFIAADLGAASGRIMVGQWNGRTFVLDELHRFPNGGVQISGHLHWDLLGIWSEIQTGMASYAARFQTAPTAIGIDAWGVDFVLLDKVGRLIGTPYHYRDSRTDGIPDIVFKSISRREMYTRTGVQTMQINTLFQLVSMVHSGDPQLQHAETLLMVPDFFHHLLTGMRAAEYTEATTTQMYARDTGWTHDLLQALNIPTRILPQIVFPGTQLGPVRGEILSNCGLPGTVPTVAVASHDTASAVAAIPNMDDTSAFISSGTWSLMGIETRAPIVSDDAFRRNFTNEGGAEGSILFLKNISGLWILQECLRHWNSERRHYAWEDLASLASREEPLRSVLDVDDPDFLAPANMPAAIADYCRRTSQAQPQGIGAITRCCFESLSLKYRVVLESLEKLSGRRLETIRIAGGGCLNSLLCQMTADACDRLVVAGPAEASALGNVMVQAIATGHLRSVNEGRAAIAGSVECKQYSPRRSEAWEEAYLRLISNQQAACTANN
jgi:rhamnulokinase